MHKSNTAVDYNDVHVQEHVIALDDNGYSNISYTQSEPVDITASLKTAEKTASRATNYDYGKHNELRIVRVILKDLLKNSFTYFLLCVLTAMALYKIHQVQQTRDITARFNQVITDNENLHKKWLLLTAEKQKLSEHTKIKEQALGKLKMISPKTDSELVINLN